MKKFWLSVLAAIIFFIDRLIKYYAPSINIGGGFVKFGFYQNYSGAFSLPLAGALYNIAGVIFIFLFFYFFISAIRKKDFAKAAACEFIWLGGLSNTFDRLYYGYVIDYFNFIGRSFFNIADGMLIVGIVVLLFGRYKMSNIKVQ